MKNEFYHTLFTAVLKIKKECEEKSLELKIL